jgi:hypothetical protein
LATSDLRGWGVSKRSLSVATRLLHPAREFCAWHLRVCRRLTFRVDILNTRHTPSFTNAWQAALVRGDIGALTPAQTEAVCANNLWAPMEITDRAVLESLEGEILHPAVIERATRRLWRVFRAVAAAGTTVARSCLPNGTAEAPRHAGRHALAVHIMAAMAQHERDLISRRTKEALAVVKAKGRKLGASTATKKFRQASEKGWLRSVASRQQKADAFAQLLGPILERYVAQTGTWTQVRVSRVLSRLKATTTATGNGSAAP